MTSKISFSKLTFDEVRRLSWLAALQFLVFGMLIPLRILIVLAANASDARKYGDTVDYLTTFCNNVGFGHQENTFFILGAGIFCALCVFGYLHSSAKLDFLHSLPLRRERLFSVKYVAGVLTFVIAYGFSQLLAILIGIFYGAVNPGAAAEVVFASAQGLLYFLCSYSATLVAMTLTGRMITSVFAVCVFGLYLPMMILILLGFQNLFFPVLPTLLLFGRSVSETELLRVSSPWAYCLYQSGYENTAKLGLTGPVPDMADLCQLIAIAALLTLISMALYCKRRTESAGNALAFGRLESVIKLMLMIPVAVIASMVAYELFDNLALELVFIVLFGTLACMIMEFIYRWDIRQALARKSHILITVIVSAVIFLGGRFDVTGINSYLPAKEDVQSMSVRDSYFSFRYEIDGVSYDSSTDKAVLDYLETDNVDAIYRLAESGVENVPDGWKENVSYVGIKFHMKNGKEIYRCYWVDDELLLDTMEVLFEEESYRERFFPILGWTEEDADQVVGSPWLPEESIQRLKKGNEGTDDSTENRTEFSEKEEKTPGDDGKAQEYNPDDGTEYTPEDMEYVPEDDEYAVGYGDWEVTEATESLPDLSGAWLWKVVSAYQKDLRTVSYRDYRSAPGCITLTEMGSYRYLGGYPTGENFPETMKVFAEILKEMQDGHMVG